MHLGSKGIYDKVVIVRLNSGTKEKNYEGILISLSGLPQDSRCYKSDGNDCGIYTDRGFGRCR